ASDPPILIIHGTEDPLVPIAQSDSFAAKLVEAGVKHELIRVEGAGHSITDQRIMMRAVRFFDEHLGGRGSEFIERELRERIRRQEQDAAPTERPPTTQPQTPGMPGTPETPGTLGTSRAG